MTSPGTTWTYREAIREAIADEMRSDPTVVLLGEDVAAAGGAFKVTEGLLAEFGADRVRDTPISEQAIVGGAIGAAMLGYRPIVEIMFADFAAVCYDQIANQLAKHEYLTGGQATLPVTIRLANGAGQGFGAQHSQPVENWFLGQAGLHICTPSSPSNAYALLRQAVQTPRPVLVFEHKSLYAVSEERVPPTTATIGQAAVVHEGRQVTVVAVQATLLRSLAVADRLASKGISLEVIDLGTLRPLDLATVARSVEKTSRLVCVQEGEAFGGWGEHVITSIVGSAFDFLDAHPVLIASPPTPIPHARRLEDEWVPTEERIENEVMRLISVVNAGIGLPRLEE